MNRYSLKYSLKFRNNNEYWYMPIIAECTNDAVKQAKEYIDKKEIKEAYLEKIIYSTSTIWGYKREE